MQQDATGVRPRTKEKLMSMRSLVVIVATFFVSSGLTTEIYQRDGPIFERCIDMSEEQKNPVVPETTQPVAETSPPGESATPPPNPPVATAPVSPLEVAATPPTEVGAESQGTQQLKGEDSEFIPQRESQATTRRTSIPLDRFILYRELYCLRDGEELNVEDRLKALKISLTTEGLQSPVEFVLDANGQPVLVKGFRRISAMRSLARDNVPGFTASMPVEADEVLNATPQDLLCRAVSDNTIRKSYSPGERLRAALALHKGGVEVNRAAITLDLSVKQFRRDLRIAKQEWMMSRVETEDIGHTPGSDLLEAAESAGRMPDLKRHAESWWAAKHVQYGADKKLRSVLTKALCEHWISLLKEGKPLDDNVPEPKKFRATIDPDTRLITLDAQVDLLTDPLEKLKQYEDALKKVQLVISEFRTARAPTEGARGAQDIAREMAKELEQLGMEPEPKPMNAEKKAETGN
jgi:hypothetical protein